MPPILTTVELDEAIENARSFRREGRIDCGDARDYVLALIQLADACVIGRSCAKHAGAVHGHEAEELRAGIEQALANTADVRPEDAEDVLRSLRKALVFLLDRVDARDSLAFLEATEEATCA